MIILGVDPGKNGALALYDSVADSCIVYDMPCVAGEVNPALVAEIIRANARPDHAYVELVHAMPKNGAVSMFSFGMSYGMVRGVIATLGIPISLVTPTTWKRHYKLTAEKEEARWMAINLWPGSTNFSRKKDDGRAESALIAKYGASILK